MFEGPHAVASPLTRGDAIWAFGPGHSHVIDALEERQSSVLLPIRHESISLTFP